MGLPPPLGLVSLLIVNSTWTLLLGEDPFFVGMDLAGMSFSSFWVFAYFSYAFFGAQAIVYSLLMEFLGQRILKKWDRGATPLYLGFSITLGTFAGITFLITQFALAGALTGLLVGIFLILLSRKSE